MPVGAFAAGIGSAVSSIMNSYFNSENNREIENMNEQQRRFQRWMYEDSKRYNSIQNQVKRMRSTGLNPAFALGGLQAGAAQAMSAPAASPPNPTQIGDIAGALTNGLQTDINAKLASAQERNLESQSSKNEQETAGIQIDNLFRKENWKSIIYNRDTESWLKDSLADVAKLDVAFNKESFKQRLQNLKYEGELKDAQIAAQDIVNQFLPHLQSATYNELVSRAVANYATGRSSLRTAMAAVMNAETERGKLRAQFGDDEKSQKDYFNSVMDLMFERRQNYASGSYKNFLTAPVKIGLSEVSGAAPLGVKLGAKIGHKYNK